MFKIEFLLKWCGFHQTLHYFLELYTILRCASVFLVYRFFSEWKREVLIEQTWFLSTVFLCGECKLENIYSGYIFGAKILAVLFICRNLFLWIAEKNAKIANIRNCQNFVSHSSLPNFLSYGAPLMHVSHYSLAITQRPRHNDGWIANMLLCPYEIKSKLSLYYHPCRVNISQKDFKLICGVLCGPIKLWLHELSLEEI